MARGCDRRVLDVDLAARTFEFRPLDEETARRDLGGKGCGAPRAVRRTGGRVRTSNPGDVREGAGGGAGRSAPPIPGQGCC